ncbi:MAG TPA: hypothetical protein VMQ39_00630 [Candidatus Dormibacteraeota bacterium]|jgi:hypothetical protein|nr:hypothetical protein [Candidatus Dormibacteraeota bacterium]
MMGFGALKGTSARSTSSLPSADFTRAELRTLRGLKTPTGIQRFLDELPYNLSFTARSPQKVLRDRTASCLEGGIFAAAALRALGFPPLIFDLEADQDTDHVVAIFKMRGHWGAVAKSNFTGCRYREPVYRSLRELAISYFNIYFNLRGERTLRRYSRPVNLSRFDRLHWMTTEEPIWFIAEHLCEIPHIRLLTPPMEKRLTRVDPRTFKAEMVGHRKKEFTHERSGPRA